MKIIYITFYLITVAEGTNIEEIILADDLDAVYSTEKMQLNVGKPDWNPRDYDVAQPDGNATPSTWDSSLYDVATPWDPAHYAVTSADSMKANANKQAWDPAKYDVTKTRYEMERENLDAFFIRS